MRERKVTLDQLIAAAMNDSDALSCLAVLFFDERCERCCACAFREVVRVGEENTNGVGDFIVTDTDDTCRALPDDFQRLGLRIATRQPVRKRLCRCGRDRAASLER